MDFNHSLPAQKVLNRVQNTGGDPSNHHGIPPEYEMLPRAVEGLSVKSFKLQIQH